MTDVNHCGSCNFACSLFHATAACIDGECAIVSCDFSFADCDFNPFNGCETHILDDERHCGRCNDPCDDGEVCTNGICVSIPPIRTPDAAPSNGCA